MKIQAHVWLRGLAAAVALALLASISGMATPAAHAALGGPVIIGGDDLTDHGSVDGSGNPIDGWLYIQRALENIKPNVTRSNDGSVAAIGTGSASDGDAGAAIAVASAKAGLTVNYHEGAAAIDQFFTDLAAGTAHPAIIWISGTGASGDLDSTEAAALNTHGPGIAGFVNSGGGLLSHGTEYGWLFSLLPGASTVSGGSSDDLYLTPDGLAAFPGVTNTDVNAGPWHNHFEGDFGGLKVLVRSHDVLDKNEQDAAVIIGGSAVTLPGAPAPTAAAPKSVPTPCIPGILESRCFDTVPQVNVTVPAPTATTVPPTVAPAQPAPVSTVLGVSQAPRTGAIAAPNTGAGPDTSGGVSATSIALLALFGAALLGSAAALRARRR
ncbi:MAG TPA: hypothetical protein VEZ14_07510 [Dehalococcoidia bacterium]|nr:hypothetical protein [Dehalococcoidia bacterium]